jgi:addiction module HigA family antidote
MRMHNPAHPGEILKELWLKPLGLSVTEAARILGVTRKTLSELLNGRAGVSTEMAMRLSLAFDTTPESWLHNQMIYDLWQTEKKRAKIRVDRNKILRIRRAKEKTAHAA